MNKRLRSLFDFLSAKYMRIIENENETSDLTTSSLYVKAGDIKMQNLVFILSHSYINSLC